MAASDGLEFALQQTSSSSNSSSSNSNNNNNNHNVTNNNNSNYNHVTHAQAPPPPLLPITTSSMSLPTAAAASTHIAPLEAAKYCPLMPRTLENLVIYENFDVHETHRIEDGVCTHITRLPPKKQELLKQFGIQSSSQQSLSYYEKYIIVENFNKFCNEYQISDHRPFLDFHESGLPKCEQLKFVRYLGQGIPNLTLNKIYVGFKDLLGMSRLDKVTLEGYSLETLLKKKRKNLYNRLQAAGDL